jgi:general secretion pathway protein N
MTRALAVVLGLVLGLLAWWPARLLLPAPPLAASAVTGPIWRATLSGASLGSARIGDLDLAFEPAAIARGRASWQVRGTLSGRLWRSLAGGGAEGLSGRLAGAPLPGLAVAQLALTQLDVAVDGRGRCLSAAGQVQVTLASALAGQTALHGAPRCEAGALLLPLASDDGRVQLDMALRSAGWQARLTVAGIAGADAAALLAGGFRRDGNRLVQEREGRW